MKSMTKLIGKNPGPVSLIMAGAHGNEVCGIRAFEKLLPNLRIGYGTVYFILGNPKAIKKCVRFVEANINRMYLSPDQYSYATQQTYEYKRAQNIKKIMDKCDAMLDIHSSLSPGEPFIICERNADGVAGHLPADLTRVVYGFDALEPGASDGYMLAQGKIGICIECGQHEDPHSIAVAEKSILSFLGSRGHISPSKIEKIEKREAVQMTSVYCTKTESFIVPRKFVNFEKVAKGTLIGVDGTEEVRAESDSVVVFAHDCHKKGVEAYLLGSIVE